MVRKKLIINNNNKQNKNMFLIGIALTIFIILFTTYLVYIYYVSPIRQLHTISDIDFLKNFMKKQLLASKDNKLLNTFASHIGNVQCNMNYWYLYYHIRTEHHTLYILINLQNKFSDKVNICFYGFDYTKNTSFNEIVPIKFSDISIKSISSNVVNIKHTNILNINIDFANNIMDLSLVTPNHSLQMNFLMDDWNTNQPTFFPRYQRIAGIVDVYGPETKTPGEWMVDSPFIGKVTSGIYNGTKIYNGNFWFDTYIGTNNNFLSPYMWFYIINDDWSIYLLQYGEYDVRWKSSNVQPILIKNRKTNKYIYSGINMDIAQPFNAIRNATSKFSFKYNLNDAELGDPKLSKFDVNFESDLIDIKIQSIPEEAHLIFSYDYYRNDELDTSKMSQWDKEYYNCIKNIRFIEHLSMADVTIKYNGVTTTFRERILYEGKRRITKNYPPSIKYNKI